MTRAPATGPQHVPEGVPVVVGAGLAGLLTAHALAPQPCVLLSPGRLGAGTASGWAQGGLAAALDPEDSPAAHAGDTLAAGSRLGVAETVDRVTAAAPGVVDLLLALGVAFDRLDDGRLALGLEGGHGRHRIVHVGGDRTGAGIMAAVTAAVAALPSVTVLEHTRATALRTEDGRVTGVATAPSPGRARGATTSAPTVVPTDRVVLATGGAAAVYRDTTNPLGSHGHGLALAARAGAGLADLEFVQFHPTALDVGRDPMPLLSEALRGAGGVLLADGRRFVDELAPRDVVAAAVWQRLAAGQRVALDVRGVPDLAHRFTGLVALGRDVGLDPLRDLLPVRPAAHYHMGGVATDAHGRTSVPGLWAAGEVARTGLHGANRLASNSLLEAAVTGRAVAADLPAGVHEHAAPTTGTGSPDPVATGAGAAGPPASGAGGPAAPSLADVRALMSEHCGVVRDADGLSRALDVLAPHTADDHALVAWLLCRAALARPGSVGGHLRRDDPARRAALASAGRGAA